MKSQAHSFRYIRNCLFALGISVSSSSFASEQAHVHGLVHLDVAVDASTLLVQLEAPLDSLLGFEHRPRTDAQKRAVDNLLKQLQQNANLIRPNAEALCKPIKTTIESEILKPNNPKKTEDEHAELEASFELNCEKADKLNTIEIGFFDTFKRIKKIEVQVASSKGQLKQSLKRPQKIVKLVR